jgi:hypothetical protein
MANSIPLMPQVMDPISVPTKKEFKRKKLRQIKTPLKKRNLRDRKAKRNKVMRENLMIILTKMTNTCKILMPEGNIILIFPFNY